MTIEKACYYSSRNKAKSFHTIHIGQIKGQRRGNGKIKPKRWQHEGDPVDLRIEVKYEPRKELSLQEVEETRTMDTSQ